MKKLLYIFLFLLFAVKGFSQNLIPNGDFEVGPDSTSEGWCCRVDTVNSNCTIVGTVLGPDFWTVISQTPDRLIEGDIITGPIACEWDNDTAQSGKAWIDFVYNEAGKTTLLATIQKDTLYHLSYYASLETFHGLSTQPSRIEFRFNNTGNTISSPYITTSQWQYYDTLFMASENSTELEIWGIEFIQSGVKLDNISLEKYIATGLNDIRNTYITLFPNPVKDKLIINNKNHYSISDIEIVNSFGSIIQKIKSAATNNFAIDVSSFPNGFYVIRLKINNSFFNKPFIINH